MNKSCDESAQEQPDSTMSRLSCNCVVRPQDFYCSHCGRPQLAGCYLDDQQLFLVNEVLRPTGVELGFSKDDSGEFLGVRAVRLWSRHEGDVPF